MNASMLFSLFDLISAIIFCLFVAPGFLPEFLDIGNSEIQVAVKF